MVIRVALVALLLLSAGLPALDTVAQWDTTSYAGWPGVGLSAVLFLSVGERARWPMLAAQTVGLGVVVAFTYDVAWWLGPSGSLAVTLPAMVSAHWLRPGTAAYRRFSDGEVDAYHGVTAVSGAVCGLLSGAAAYAAGRGDIEHALLTALISFFAATTAQLVVLPFWLRREGGWNLTSSVELWAQRAMLISFSAAVFLPHSAPPATFLLFPILGWAAIRARAAETHAQVLVISIAAFAATLAGRGPLALGSLADPDQFSPLLVYAFMASICYLLVPLALTVERLTAVTRDATRSASTVRRMLDSATGTVFIATDATGVVTHYNSGAERVLGFPAGEMVGRRGSSLHSLAEVLRQADIFGVDSAAADLYSAVVAAQVASGQRSDWQFQHRHGADRVISLSISAMTEPGRGVVGYIASGEDSTDRVAAQLALEQALIREQRSVEALRAANQMKQELVSTVSHELRTPITSITGFAEVLREGHLGPLVPRQLSAVERIERNSTRLRRLVDDLLTLSRSESGALPGNVELVDLNTVAKVAHDLLRDQVNDRDLEVRFSPARRPVIVVGNDDLLERAVINLWSNAIKFTPDGGTVDLVVDTRPDGSAPGGLAVIVVRDTGIGIPPEEHDAVFDRFHRTAGAGERAIQGTGLGLSIVKTIIEQHHGTISLESALGVGTSITLAIPLAESTSESV